MNYDNLNNDFLEPNFEPLSRERANTWHGPGQLLQTDYLKEEDQEEAHLDASIYEKKNSNSKKLASSRRNAWGNMSYSDLIMQAIESSEEKRLTLVQIYSYMIQHVPYFQERADGPSSVGWKNSIRHNLSLHPQFMRQPNDKTGKSSWWIINHSAIKPSRSRRTNIISESNKNCFYPGIIMPSQGQPCVSISETDETDTLQSYLPITSNSAFRKRTFSNPIISSNLKSFEESDLQLKMLRRASDEINDEIETLIKMRPRAPSDGVEFYKNKPLFYYLNQSDKNADNNKNYGTSQKNDDELSKDLEWFIPSGQFDLLSKPSSSLSTTALSGPHGAASAASAASIDHIEPSESLSVEEEALEKCLLFQLMKSDKITKLRQRNPEFERRICEAIRKKKRMILMQQQQKDALIDLNKKFSNTPLSNKLQCDVSKSKDKPTSFEGIFTSSGPFKSKLSTTQILNQLKKKKVPTATLR